MISWLKQGMVYQKRVWTKTRDYNRIQSWSAAFCYIPVTYFGVYYYTLMQSLFCHWPILIRVNLGRLTWQSAFEKLWEPSLQGKQYDDIVKGLLTPKPLRAGNVLLMAIQASSTPLEAGLETPSAVKRFKSHIVDLSGQYSGLKWLNVGERLWNQFGTSPLLCTGLHDHVAQNEFFCRCLTLQFLVLVVA